MKVLDYHTKNTHLTFWLRIVFLNKAFVIIGMPQNSSLDFCSMKALEFKTDPLT